jgi:hypothetical protein
MKSNNPALEHLLRQGELKPLIEHALKIHQLNQAIALLLPEGFAGNVQVATIKSGSVILEVLNASMLTVLKYQGPELLSKLRQLPGLAGLASVKFRVGTRHAAPLQTQDVASGHASPADPYKRISPETSALLRSMADKIEDDGLKAALLSLASKT